jgi:hypothetical protein
MMSGVFAKPGARREDTDLYDAQDRRVLVRFPTLLVITLTVTGVIAFGLIGYLGYNSDSTIIQDLFSRAWPVFLWFSALVLTLEVAVLRHPSRRRYLVEALLVTLISMLFAAAVAIFPDVIKRILQSINLSDLALYISNIGAQPLTYLVVNFGVILIFWADTLRRWLIARSGNPQTRVIELGVGALEFGEEGELPTLPELIAGDLIAGGVLVAVLALIFRVDVLNPIYQVLQTGEKSLTSCVVSLTLSYPTCGSAVTISRVDIIQALIYLPIGLFTLALTAVNRAFIVAGQGRGDQETDGDAQADGDEQTAVATPWQDQGQALSADLHPVHPDTPADGRGNEKVQVSIIEVIYEALRAPLQRRIRLVLDNLLIALRNVVWPVFILLAMLALGQASKSLAFYLRTQSNRYNCTHDAPGVVGGALQCHNVEVQLAQGLLYGNLAAGIGLVIAAAIAIVIAMMMLVFSLRVATNMFRFLGVIAWLAALTLWLYSLSLSVSNRLFNLVDLTLRQPFPIFGVSTTASLLVFLLACLILYISRQQTLRRMAALTRQRP